MKKVSTRSKLATAKGKAWEAFARYIRARDPKCICCGNPTKHAGHFWHGLLDFDEVNVNGQCAYDNTYLHGNLAQYAVNLIAKVGKKEFDALAKRKIKAKKGEIRTIEDYKAIEEKYKQKLFELSPQIPSVWINNLADDEITL